MRVSVRRASTVLIHCVVPEHIHTPPPLPWKIIGNSKGMGGGVERQVWGGGFMGNYFYFGDDEGDEPRTKH